jgi:signal transduction histidine kinase
MTDVVLESLRALVIAIILLFFWHMGRQEGLVRQKGFRYIIIGLAFVFLGSLVDITDTLPQLNKFIILGTTLYQSIIEKLGYLTGLVLLGFGFRNWIPLFPALMHAEEAQKRQNERLEQLVAERTAELSEANRQLQQEVEERKQAQEALAIAHEQAMTVNRLKSQFLANVSHDLRTPLNAVLGYSEMLREGIYGTLSDEQQEANNKIIDSTTHLLDMINNLLDQAEIESETISLKCSPFKPAELIDTTILTLGPRAEARHLKLSCQIDPNLPDTLNGDLYALRRILTNLVSNAIKFTDQGEVAVSILRCDEAHWSIQVADTGRGIPPQALEYIFEPFRRIDGAPIDGSGAGLGLSIVKHLVTLMKGDISTKSHLGQGSTFTARLPLNTTQEFAA